MLTNFIQTQSNSVLLCLHDSCLLKRQYDGSDSALYNMLPLIKIKILQYDTIHQFIQSIGIY